MKSSFRVVSWNCRRASTKSRLWDYLLELDPDIALLQDFGRIPDRVLLRYGFFSSNAPPGDQGSVRFMTGILFKGTVSSALTLPAPVDWVRKELEIYRSYFSAAAIVLQNGLELRAMSVYSPAIPISRVRMKEVDTTGIQLTQNRDVWVTELMWATLKSMAISPEEPFVVAGDLNSSETFDYLWKGGARGNKEIIERMNALGFYDCLRLVKRGLLPTFRTPRDGQVIHQLDHLYVTPIMLSWLTSCDVGSSADIFEPRPMLSDHLPIVADFSFQTVQ